MKKTNFDRYLEEQLKNPEFAQGFERAGEVWEVASNPSYKSKASSESLARFEPPASRKTRKRS